MEKYSISQLSSLFATPASTLRYYEEIGLLRDVARAENGQRLYDERHIRRMNAIACFKRTGLPIAGMLDFFRYDEHIPEHIDDIVTLVSNHEQAILGKIEELAQDLRHIQQKVRFYRALRDALSEGAPLPRFDDFA